MDNIYWNLIIIKKLLKIFNIVNKNI
jgi:hypothetical protein